MLSVKMSYILRGLLTHLVENSLCWQAEDIYIYYTFNYCIAFRQSYKLIFWLLMAFVKLSLRYNIGMPI